MDYHQLLRAYNNLLEENAALKKENKFLRNQFSVSPKMIESVQEQKGELEKHCNCQSVYV